MQDSVDTPQRWMGFGIMFIMIQNPLPDPVGTKRDAFMVGLGIFLALRVLLGGQWREGAVETAIMMRDPLQEGLRQSSMPLRSSLYLMNIGAEGDSHQFPLLATASKQQRNFETRDIRIVAFIPHS